MVLIKVSDSVAAPPGKVFAFLRDFEKVPRYSNYWKSVKFLKSEGNATTYEIVAEAVGRSMTSITRMTGFPNERIEAETIEGDGKGTKLTFNLKVVPTGTEITLEGDVILPGFAKLLGSAIKGRIESGMQDELKIVKDVLEKT